MFAVICIASFPFGNNEFAGVWDLCNKIMYFVKYKHRMNT